MKKLFSCIFMANLILAGCSSMNSTSTNMLKVAQVKTPKVSMSFSSPDIVNQGVLTSKQVANAFGCQGSNISPELNWSNAPQDTKSFAVTVYDPDAPTGSGFWHWVVYNIPAHVNKLERNSANNIQLLPKGAVQSVNDTGSANFLGACPPVGDKAHRYIYTIYALNTMLDVNEKTTPAVLGFSLNGKVLAKSQFVGYYKR